MGGNVKLTTDAFLSRVEESVRYGLMEEVQTTPKPGLVDLWDSGAHTDMDFSTFAASTEAITPYLTAMAGEGIALAHRPDQLFPKIRVIGVEGEKAMFRATKGVNTHKGILFLLGILAAAAGVCFQREGVLSPDRKTVLQVGREIASPYLEEELNAISRRPPRTHGEQLYVQYGIRGVRGEVLEGFPSLSATAFPAMEAAKASQPDENAARLFVLLKLMSCVEDTNILFRSDRQTLRSVQQISTYFLHSHPVLDGEALCKLREMNRDFIRLGISPGGCADLLAVTLFKDNEFQVWITDRQENLLCGVNVSLFQLVIQPG